MELDGLEKAEHILAYDMPTQSRITLAIALTLLDIAKTLRETKVIFESESGIDIYRMEGG